MHIHRNRLRNRLTRTAKRLMAGFAVSSLLGLSACANTGILGAKKLEAIATSSSCSNPVIFKHVLKRDDEASLSSDDIPQADRTARVDTMGFKGAAPVAKSDCADAGITKYQLASTDEAPVNFLYAKHMTNVAIKADPNVKCKPTYTQVYQPPLKLGGTGGVIQVSSGEKCGVVR